MSNASIESVYEVANNHMQKQWLEQHFTRIYNHYVQLMQILIKHPRVCR